MVYEIILALARGAERAGLSAEQTRGLFYHHGERLLRRVRGGELWELGHSS
jgi:hypothetical protein